MRRRAGAAVGALGIALVTSRLGGRRRHPSPAPFASSLDAQPELHRLWDASVGAKAERVACLAATIGGDTVRDLPGLSPRTRSGRLTRHLGRVHRWRTAARPSGGVRCTPTWRSGTAVHPYSLFSGADRGVMMLWWRRWETDGIFCLLYSPDEVICEIEGPEGAVLFPRSHY